jgi:hypothetical protein
MESKLKKLIEYVNRLVEHVNKLERRIDVIEHAAEHKQQPSTIHQLTGEDE